jgi:dTDP-glucose 4,6-dehydratase
VKLLVTGAGGFVGHHLIDYVLRTTDWEVIATQSRVNDSRLVATGASDNPRVKLLLADLRFFYRDLTNIDYIVHLAAKTKIDESIARPRQFVESNMLSTLSILECARRFPNLKKLLYFSTDEVFGPASPEGEWFGDWDRYNSCNPYAASKAAGEELCLAWANTYGVPVIITHAQNLIGERQAPEKFLPTLVRSALNNEMVRLYVDVDSANHFPHRDYLHARDAASAVCFLLERGQARDKYNIARLVGGQLSSHKVLCKVGDILKRTIIYNKVPASSVRSGFVPRFGLDGAKLFDLGWTPPKTFEQNLEETVQWMVREENLHWLNL